MTDALPLLKGSPEALETATLLILKRVNKIFEKLVNKPDLMVRTEIRKRVPIGLFNPVIPTKIFPHHRNPDGFCRLIPILNIRFKKCLTEVPDSLMFGEPVEDGRIRKVVRSK